MKITINLITLLFASTAFTAVDPYIYQIFSDRTQGAYKTANCPAFDDYTYGFGEYAEVFSEDGKLKVSIIGNDDNCRLSRVVSTFSFPQGTSKFIRSNSDVILQKVLNTKTKNSIGILKDGSLRFQKTISGESNKELCDLKPISREELPDVDDLCE